MQHALGSNGRWKKLNVFLKLLGTVVNLFCVEISY